MQIMCKIWKAALNFVYPSSCMLCQASLPDSPGLCDSCWDDIDIWDSGLHEVGFEHEFDQIVILYQFNDCVRSLIHALKYRGKTLPGQIVGKALGQRIGGIFDSDTVIVPVPLHSAKKRARGYNQSEIIARATGRVSGLQVLANALKRVRPTPTQTQLGVLERQYNVQGAFHVRCPAAIEGRKIFLIDDVITTGATLNACVLALRSAGAQCVSVGAVASPLLGEDDLSQDVEKSGS